MVLNMVVMAALGEVLVGTFEESAWAEMLVRAFGGGEGPWALESFRSDDGHPSYPPDLEACRRLGGCTKLVKTHNALLPLGCTVVHYRRHCWRNSRQQRGADIRKVLMSPLELARGVQVCQN